MTGGSRTKEGEVVSPMLVPEFSATDNPHGNRIIHPAAPGFFKVRT